jgi:hypothetical protein
MAKVPYVPAADMEAGGANSLMQNKLMWQLLSAGGQDLLAGQPIGANVHQVTNQNIRAQNFAKMLQDMLGQGGKLSMNADGLSFKVPTSALGNQSAPAGTSHAYTEGTDAPTPGQPTGKVFGGIQPSASQRSSNALDTNFLSMLLASGGAGNMGPSSSPLDFSPSDLAGLMPEDISNALRFKMAQDEMAQASTEKSISNLLKSRELDLEERKMLQEKDTPTIREYEYAVRQGYTGSIEDYRKEASNPERLDMYKKATDQGYTGTFMDWLGEYSRLTKPVTNINIGDKVATAEALEKMKSRMWFTSPTGMAEDMNKLLSSDDVKRQLLRHPPGSVARSRAEAKAVGDEIQSRIIAAGGTFEPLTEESMKGKTITWKVTWDDGKRSEVRYAFK